MKRVIVGTAGHIDHGKTSLIKALTGVDCDRWAEEKDRGITIDLGFAHLQEDDLQVGFIDVPGHEKFLRNALAGLGGIRIALLVVAADEGVKPQTREHMAICTLLEIPACLVVLTKSDLVSPDLLELATMEVEELLTSTPFSDSTIIAASSSTGEGIEQVRQHLFELAAIHETPINPNLPVRLPIDRGFHLKGLGVVVTGTLVSGVVRQGETLELAPQGTKARIRSVQIHGESRPEAVAGERTALQLTGPDLHEVVRGEQLSTPGSFLTTTSLLGRMTLLPETPKPLRGSVQVGFHLFTSEVPGRLRPLDGDLEPGRSGLVEIVLARPVVAVRGDRFIVRRPSPAATMGGGVLLDPDWHRRRGRQLSVALTALQGNSEETLVAWVEEGGEAGVATEELARRLGRHVQQVEKVLQRLSTDQKVLRAPEGAGHGPRWLTPSAYRRVVKRAEKVLGRYFADRRLATGIPKAEAIERILPHRAAELSDVYLDWLQAQGVLVLDGDRIDLPGRTAELTGEESKLAAGLRKAFDAGGLQPPSPGELQATLEAKPKIREGVTSYLVDRGVLSRLPGDLLISSAAIDRVHEDLQQSGWETFSVGDFKQRYGLTRKWAIPILEHLDSRGTTRRVGDRRMVVRGR